jgi:hypothetical protein
LIKCNIEFNKFEIFRILPGAKTRLLHTLGRYDGLCV